ncbi:MAG: alpha-hydroxy acid oxidase [Pseudomonadota bacterium]
MVDIEKLRSNAVLIEDLRRKARKRLPRIVYDWLDGGAGDERALEVNRRQYASYGLLPRYLAALEGLSTTTAIFGKTYAMPYGISPTGFGDLCWPGAELMLARAAASAQIPFVLSGAGIVALEKAAAASQGFMWYQLYPTRDPRITDDLVRRAAAAGVETLVVTVDLPVASRRPRDIRNGFGLPPRLGIGLIWDGLSHPGWTMRFYRNGGVPLMENWVAYAPRGASKGAVARLASQHYHAAQTWDDVAAYRRLWQGNLVLKGIQHVEDAARALSHGVDGIIVSNHGGRQFDKALGTLATLTQVVDRVGDRMIVMLDGGIRSGSDAVVALALGARLVFSGRCTLYGISAYGEAGCMRAIEIIREGIEETLMQIGCPQIAGLNRDFVRERPA